MVNISILYRPCFFESFSLSPNCTGIRHRSSWKLYSKFDSCFRTRLSAFHIRIVYILYTCSRNENSCLGMSQIAIITITTLTALMSNNNHNLKTLTFPFCKCTSMRVINYSETELKTEWVFGSSGSLMLHETADRPAKAASDSRLLPSIIFGWLCIKLLYYQLHCMVVKLGLSPWERRIKYLFVCIADGTLT